jgi:hypothetical protein
MLFTQYTFSEKPQMWGGFGVISLVSFVLMYVYDLVLNWLSPRAGPHLVSRPQINLSKRFAMPNTASTGPKWI